MSIKTYIQNFKWTRQHTYYAIGGGVGLIALASYHAYQQYNLLKQTCLLPGGWIPNKLTMNDADINIKLNLKNKSGIDYSIKKQDYTIYINSVAVGKIKNTNMIYVAPNRPTPLWLNLKFDPSQLSGVSWSILKDVLVESSSVKIRIKGEAKISKYGALIRYTYPVDSTFTIKELTSSSQTDC